MKIITRNKLYFKIFASFLAAIVLLYSCKKFLDKKPVGALGGDVLATGAGVDGLLIGAYSMLDGYGTTTTSWESGIDNWIWGSVAADDAYKGSNTTDQPDAVPIENHTIESANGYLGDKWKAFYDAVQRANDVIREIPLVTDGSLTPEHAAEVTAEARFLRGVFHLEVSKLWRNVPYVSDSVTYAAGNYNVPNNNNGALVPIWDKIEDDFKAAMDGLPKTQSDAGRANYYAAEAFLAKTYMFDHQYTQALPLLNDLIENGTTSSGAKYALQAFEDNFDPIKRNGPEAVFQVQMTSNDGSGGQNGNEGEVLNFPAGPWTGCCGFYQPSYSLGNAYKVDANGLPMLGRTTVTISVFNADNTTTHSVSATLPDYDLVNLKTDHGLTATDPFTPPTDALDPRIDWTLGRRGIPYLDWGICGGENWSRGDIVPYNPIKNSFYHAEGGTFSNGQGWAQNQDVANNYNLIRFADVILWRAECEIETNDLQALKTM